MIDSQSLISYRLKYKIQIAHWRDTLDADINPNLVFFCIPLSFIVFSNLITSCFCWYSSSFSTFWYFKAFLSLLTIPDAFVDSFSRTSNQFFALVRSVHSIVSALKCSGSFCFFVDWSCFHLSNYYFYSFCALNCTWWAYM